MLNFEFPESHFGMTIDFVLVMNPLAIMMPNKNHHFLYVLGWNVFASSECVLEVPYLKVVVTYADDILKKSSCQLDA